jgi:hypothetical protein
MGRAAVCVRPERRTCTRNGPFRGYVNSLKKIEKKSTHNKKYMLLYKWYFYVTIPHLGDNTFKGEPL